MFDAFKGALADEIYAEYGPDLANVPADNYARQMHAGDIEAFLSNQEICNPDILRQFTDQLRWPLYYLDYESIQPAVPMFDNSRPYQQICFQFSLHVQRGQIVTVAPQPTRMCRARESLRLRQE